MRFAVAVALTTWPALAETMCDGAQISVSAANEATSAYVCEASRNIIERLELCGLPIISPVSVEITEDRPSNDDLCLGVYHCGKGQIEIVDPKVMPELVGEENPYFGIDFRELFALLLGHELVHAAVDQANGAENISLIEDEYIAYAISLDVLPRTTRSVLISQRNLKLPVSRLVLDEIIYGLDPTSFGLLAWLHFSQPDNGCEFVSNLIDGSTSLGDHEIIGHP